MCACAGRRKKVIPSSARGKNGRRRKSDASERSLIWTLQTTKHINQLLKVDTFSLFSRRSPPPSGEHLTRSDIPYASYFISLGFLLKHCALIAPRIAYAALRFALQKMESGISSEAECVPIALWLRNHRISSIFESLPMPLTRLTSFSR